jgi:hypothetical protein
MLAYVADYGLGESVSYSVPLKAMTMYSVSPTERALLLFATVFTFAFIFGLTSRLFGYRIVAAALCGNQCRPRINRLLEPTPWS